MNIASIKKLVEAYDLPTLKLAEEEIIGGKHLSIEIEGNDEGEQLTHIFASIWILNQMKEKDVKFNKALRTFTQKVRNSID